MLSFLTRLGEWTNARRKRVWLLLFLLVIAAVAIVLIPMMLILPFKAQTPRILEVSYTMRRWSPLLTWSAAAIVFVLGTGLWISGRWKSRVVVVLLTIPLLGATWMAGQNHFEWMFNPLPNPAYAKLADANFISDDDRVLAVTIGEESVAYPIRLMGYHHLVGDTVGGVPIVATY